MSNEEESTKVRLKADGTLTIKVDGKDVPIATYNKTTATVEFTTKENSVKYYQQVTARIGSTGDGTQVSGNVIRSMRVKGDEVKKTMPKRPKMGPEGDAAEDIVQYYLDNDMSQAIVRYGIYTDAKGNPIQKKVRRLIRNTVDNRNLVDEDIQSVKEGPKSITKAPGMVEAEWDEKEKAIIARRATRLTYTPSEVVGGWQPDDDFEDAQVGEEEIE